MSQLRQRTISGLTWTGINQVGCQSISFIVSLVLARLLGPKAYGLIGMVTIFTGFAMRFVDLGLGAAIIQRAHLKEEHLQAVFWLNLTMGLFLMAFFSLLAPL